MSVNAKHIDSSNAEDSTAKSIYESIIIEKGWIPGKVSLPVFNQVEFVVVYGHQKNGGVAGIRSTYSGKDTAGSGIARFNYNRSIPSHKGSHPCRGPGRNESSSR